MTLDDEVPWRVMAAADRDRINEARHADYLHEREMESEAAEAARWANRWAQQSLEVAKESHPSRYIDTRCYAVEGDTDRPDQ